VYGLKTALATKRRSKSLSSTRIKQPYHVLVVDDIAVNRHLVSSALPDNEFIITEAVNGDDALALISKQAFDVVLLDIMMPGIDGITVCQRIRKNPDGKHLPVIIITSLGHDEALERSFDAGADDFLRKPFNFNELIARIRVLAERYRAYVELARSKEALEKKGR